MIIAERARCVNDPSWPLRAVPKAEKPASMLVTGASYSTLWIPIPGDRDGHCEVYRAYRVRRPSDSRFSVQFKLWRPGKPTYKLQKDQGGIVTCGCSRYSRDGECRHTDAAIEVGLV